MPAACAPLGVQVSAEGKRTSYSSLVVVGNGKGTAGIGMGKDVQPGNALYKATVDARKSLTYGTYGG